MLVVQDPEVAALAASNGRTVAQTLLRWGLQHGTSVIPKSSNPKHSQVRHNAEGTRFCLVGRPDCLGGHVCCGQHALVYSQAGADCAQPKF